MDFRKIYQMQVELDKSIEQKHNIRPEEVIDKKILALIIEVAEFANEYAPFKYWKKNIVIKRGQLIEEFVDGVHFFVSLGSLLKIKQQIEPIVVSEDKSEQLLKTISAVSKLKENFNIENLEKAFAYYMGNAALLKISNEEISTHYIDKNLINFKRIKENY